MSQNNLGGAGLGLPLPQYVSPPQLYNGNLQGASAPMGLAPGDALPVPPGVWEIVLGSYAMLQYLDPLTGGWYNFPTADQSSNPIQIKSDGENFRVANLTGCVIGAVVTGGGSAYVQSTTSVVASSGGAVFQPIVGGVLTSITVTTAGTGYTIPPVVFIPDPPVPGLAATAAATIANGTVSAITLLAQGGGYASVPSITLLPSPYDPNLANITNATAGVTSLTGTGSLVAVIVTNNGAASATAAVPTLTVTGAGASATVSAVVLSTTTSVSVSGVGVGYNANTLLFSVGGRANFANLFTNPYWENSILPAPRNIQQASVTISSTSLTAATLYDGGLFTAQPTGVVLSNVASITTAGTISLVQGAANTHVFMQPC